jgi:hypothetical protein
VAKKKGEVGQVDGDGNSIADKEAFDREAFIVRDQPTPAPTAGVKKRAERDPNKPRSYYQVLGKDSTSGHETLLVSVNTRRRADKWVSEQSALLKMLCTDVRIVRARVVGTWGA